MQIRNLLTLCLFFVLIPSVILASMDDKEFFDSLNLTYPGMEAVQTALSSGDTVLAKSKILEYYQNRSSVLYFPLSGSGDISDANDNVDHYFTVVNIRKYAGEVDGTIDWAVYDPNDKEWHFQFHRMYWLSNLGKVYGSTGDEKYALEWIMELTDWADDNSAGYPRTLDTGIRLYNWVESYQYLINTYDSPSITAEQHVILLKSLMEQCRFLSDNWRDSGNWGASETRGLGAVVTMFPEFRFTPGGNWEWWRDLVISRMNHHLVNDFSSDGVQFETSPSYHSREYRNLFLTYTLMKLNGIEISDDLKNLFIKPLEFMMHIHKPDKYLPQLSDTDKLTYLSRLEEGSDLFGRQDMKYAATRGNEGTAPANTFAPFPDGGYFVMRSDWGENGDNYDDTRYLVFDTGTDNEPWHAHYDMLNFEAYAYGVNIVRDPGRYAYTDRRIEYYKNTFAHNTIVVDNENQEEKASGESTWSTMPGFDYVCGFHEAYGNLRHTRKIFFIKPNYWIISDLVSGEGSHTYDQYFHLEQYYINNVTLGSSDHSATTPHFVIVPSDHMATVEIIEGWVSNSYASEAPAPVLKYSKEDYTPVTFETVIYPFKNQTEELQVSKFEVINALDWPMFDDEAVALKMQFSDHTDYICFNHVYEDSLYFGSFKFAGEVAYLSQLNTNELNNLEIANGSYLTKGDTLLTNTYGVDADMSWFNGYLSLSAEELYEFVVWAPLADSVIVNGKRIEFVQDGNYVLGDASTPIKKDAEMSTRFTLRQNYPNPFNAVTIISFELPFSSKVKLNIYSTPGQKVRTLINEELPLGNHTISFDATELAAGVYFYQLHTEKFSQIKKMIHLK